MIGLLTESYCNEIRTEKNLNSVSNIKKIVQKLIESRVHALAQVHNIDDNISFKEIGTDLISSLKINKSSESLLAKNQYKKTTIDRYNSEHCNCVLNADKVDYIVEQSNFKEELTINCKGIYKTLSWFIQENFIVFFNKDGNATEYFFEVEKDITLLDFKITEDDFVLLLISEKGRNYIIKSHLGLPFLELNKNESLINYDKTFYKIEIDPSAEKIIFAENSRIIFGTKEYNLINIRLGKKYFFEVEGKYFFNKVENIEEFEAYIIEKEVQLNNLNMYNYISFLGLNDFEVDGKRKISTKESDLFINLFKNKFDNTINGGLNYFNSMVENKNMDTLGGSYGSEIKKKDYLINLEDEYFRINGNFLNNYEKGEYRIEIEKDKCTLYKKNAGNYLFEKQIKFGSLEHFYFCNLNIEYKKKTTLEKPISYTLTANDGYTFINRTLENFKFEKIYNSKECVKNMMEFSKVEGIENRKTTFKFDGRKIIFYNYYDYDSKQFKYSNNRMEVKQNDKINIDKIKMYHFDGSYIVKGNFVYFREPGILNFTNTNQFVLELVNGKGYITDFWIKNQDTTIYLKNKNNTLEVVKNYNDCDYIVKIPLIKDYVEATNNVFREVSVEYNDDLETEVYNNNKLLITDKFMNEALFFKAFIEDEETVEIFDSDNKMVTNLLLEKEHDGITAYFNTERNKLYYYNSGDNKYNYFTPIKAYENIESVYNFDDNGEILLGKTKTIKSFSLNCKKSFPINETVNIFLYKHDDGQVAKIELTGAELNNIFSLELDTDNISITVPENYNYSDFSLSEIKVKSINVNNKITFLKTNRSDMVYISKETNFCEIDKIDFSKVKVNTKYNLSDGKLKESFEEDFIVRIPFEDEVLIMYKDNSNALVTTLNAVNGIGMDEFYKMNFKSPKVSVIGLNENRLISETFNDYLDMEQIIEKE